MEISEIKSRLGILEVLSHYGLSADKNHRLCCPFHDDKTPSMQVYVKTGTVYCFSANCVAHGKSLDVIDFIQRKEGLSKHEALKRAATLVGKTSGVTTPGDTSSEAEQPSIENSLLADFKLLEQNLRNGSKGADYLDKRGLSWQLLRDKAGVRLGYNNAKHAAMKHCVLFPLRAANQKITGMYGRSIYDIDGKKHYYLPERQGLFPAYPAVTATRLVLTESIIDACTLLQHTEYLVLALYGTNGLTAEHQKAISVLRNLPELTLFFDGDEPGRKALQAVSAQLRAVTQAQIRHVNTPDGEDINSLMLSHSPEILSHLIENASPWTVDTFLFSSEKSSDEKEKTVPLPAETANKLQAISTELLIYHNGSLKVAVLGGVKLTGLDRLRVTLKITDEQNPARLPVRHSLDLYHAVQAGQLQDKLTENLDIGPPAAAQLIEGLTSELETYRANRLAALQPKKPKELQLTQAEKQQALQYLKSPQLLERTAASIAKSGIVGEEDNALIAWLVYTSRKRESPLQLMCLGASGTGKTYLQEKVGELIPPEDKLEITTLSENAFYYFGREELKHKLILIEDLDGAADVLYPLRELQSKRKISKTVTLKDNKGNLKTVTLTVEGPVSVSGCTTREKLYEDNANRCLLLEIDTGPQQDARIMSYQKRQSAGLVDRASEAATRTLLQNVQRMLKPVAVRNPYAELISLPDVVFKPRRTIGLLLNFIETITFYCQYQLPVQTEPQSGEHYVETNAEHIQWAFKLLKQVLFRKSDELTGACRNFLERLKAHLKTQKAETFTAKEIRKSMRLNPSNLKRYLVELDRYGYIKGRGNRYKGYEYSITDMHEYEVLTGRINADLQRIADNINPVPGGRRPGGSVVHSGPVAQMDHSTC